MTHANGGPTRVLVAGVGYSFMRDWSIGPRLVTDLLQRQWPAGVDIEDWSFGPLDGLHRLQWADPPYDRVVYFGAEPRGRAIGTITRREWRRSDLPDPEAIQDRVGEAISGVLSLDGLIYVTAAFNALPEDVVILEVEPHPDNSMGEEYSAELTASLPTLVSYIEAEAGLVTSHTTDAQRDSE